MQGKTIIITGGTGGIGKETAIGLSKLGAHIIITGRNQQRGEQSVAEIRELSGNTKVDLLIADMASQAEIRQLVDEVINRYHRLDVLINNVGVLSAERQLTVDGPELNFAVNHLAPFLLTHLLLPLLQSSAPARVINVTGGFPKTIDLENLQAEKSYSGIATYSHSKAIMMAASYEFAQRIKDSGVTINVAYPGVAGTDMTRNMSPAMMPFLMRLFMPIARRMMMRNNASAAKAARSSIYLASSPDVEGVTGHYFNTGSKVTKWSAAVLHPETRLSIWELSETLTGMAHRPYRYT